MTRLFSTRPSPALVISLIALFVALGGTGYAALRITGKQIKNASVTGKDIKNRSINGSTKLKRNSVGGSVVRESSLGIVPNAARADTAGSAGTANSAATAATAATAAALAAIDTRFRTCTDNADGTQTFCDVECPVGERALGGGVVGEGAFADAQHVNGSRPATAAGTPPLGPNDVAVGWRGFVNNIAGGANTSITVYVVCGAANSGGGGAGPARAGASTSGAK